MSLETRNMPAFVTEQYMPPANQLRYVVVFRYVDDENTETDPARVLEEDRQARLQGLQPFCRGFRCRPQGCWPASSRPVTATSRRCASSTTTCRNCAIPPTSPSWMTQEARRRRDRVMRTATRGGEERLRGCLRT